MRYHECLLKHFRLLLATIAIGILVLLTHGNALAQATGTSIAQTDTVTSTVSTPLLLFSTPPPVRDEEALSSGSRNMPSVFDGVDEYEAMHAQSTVVGDLTSSASKPIDAVQSVVQIFLCNQFGCDTPVGTGVIVHPSGLILTAYHVLLENPNNLRSRAYDDFVIALTENPRTAPQPLCRAVSVADLDDLDIALLAINRTFDGEAIDPAELSLPALPFADVEQLFADELHVLGFPRDGGDAVNYTPATFSRFEENGQLIVVDEDLSKGNSGGPALVLQAGRMAIAGLVIRGRTTRGQLGQDGLLRAIDQVLQLGWTPDFGRARGQNIEAGTEMIDGEEMLKLAIDLSIYDRVGDRLRLLFYVVETATGKPWQPEDAAGPLAIWADLTPQNFIDANTVELTVPVDELGASPDQLSFYALLWDRVNEESIWASTEAVQGRADAVVEALEPEADEPVREEPTETPEPTAPSTATLAATPTNTPRPTATPTIDQQATEEAVEAAVAATLEALNTPTPTTNPVVVRLTEVAINTATAKARRPTATSTPRPTPKPTATPTPDRPVAGTAREFGDIPFVYVPDGRFTMGLNSGDDDEEPVHSVYLDGYWIMQTEVTNAQYTKCVDAGECREPDNDRWNDSNHNDHPVTDVSWDDAVAYADWLSAEAGRTIRLPTEAEWEKAARGPEARTYPWGNVSPNRTLLNYNSNEGGTTPVGAYPDGASPYGALDMAGNVWEWTADWYDSDYYASSPERNPQGPESGDSRVVRGGSWVNYPYLVRAPYRFRSDPDFRLGFLGFRLASSGF